MLPPVDFGRIASELSTPFGWIELALVAACFAAGWAIAHRLQLKTERSGELMRVGMGLPLAIALALIRLCVYAVRGLFGNASWTVASERAISYAIWALVILYFFDVLPQI